MLETLCTLPPQKKKKPLHEPYSTLQSPNPDAQKGASGLRGAGLDREVTAKRVYLGPQQPSVLRMYIPKSRYGALTLKNSRISLGLRWGLDPPKTPKKPCRTLLQAFEEPLPTEPQTATVTTDPLNPERLTGPFEVPT